MFYYLSGRVAHMDQNLAVIDCGGVGYACKTTNTTLAALTSGENARLYTHLNVREDAVELYGFATMEELRCYRMLTGVSGVGPKAALSILSSSNPTNLVMAIVTEDEKVLTVAPGVGKKLAKRIILELKDKLAKEQTASSGAISATGATLTIPENKVSEATAALAVLGYTPAEIHTALRGIPMDELSLEDIIRQALKKMMK